MSFNQLNFVLHMFFLIIVTVTIVLMISSWSNFTSNTSNLEADILISRFLNHPNSFTLTKGGRVYPYIVDLAKFKDTKTENILFDIADYGTGLREGKKFNNIIAARITLGTSPAQTLLYNPILLKTIEPIGDSDIEAGQKGVDKQTRKLLVMVDNKPTILTFKILQPRSVKQYAIG